MNNIKIVDAQRQLSELVDKLAQIREPIMLTSEGQVKAVLLSVEAFEELLGLQEYAHRKLIPLESLQLELQQDLVAAGYDSREKIIRLVQEVKQEMATEHQQKIAR